MSDSSLPDYHQALVELTTAALSVTPAELQGLIAGMLSGGMKPDNDNWKTILFDYTNDGMGWPVNAANLAESIFAYAVKELSGTSMELTMLLPEEDELLNYADAVSDWVNHFISGIGLAGSQLSKLSAETKEALADLEEIAKLGIDEEDDLNEQAILLEQVIEHVKVCVLTIHSDLGAKPLDAVKNKTIH
ncbi:YecA/YgfB family protein [Vibrio aphrogenes]|uniref:YecA/YgfB family protein n=1 Tax=Vibrio aphrogenes TaxID=1891186 RepID=UPI000B35A31D|nr:YecA family protein [Vibrio aphrogenes]